MTFVETLARDIARRLIAVPGWAASVDQIIASLGTMRGAIAINCANHPGIVDPNHTAGAVIARAAALLREVATGEPMDVITRYSDLMPADIRAKLMEGAIAVLRDAGATVETFKDEAGETFLHIVGLDSDALGVPADELDRIASQTPKPAGSLHRVQ